jgi:hypothetical protein
MKRHLTRRRRWSLAGLGALVAVAALVGPAVAGHLTGEVKSYTGCLATSGGTLTLIKEGNAPQKPCPSGSVVAHFSGGDITTITAGTGLTGGGTNGAVTLSVDPKYGLPQSCDGGAFAMWTGSAWVCAKHEEGIGLDRTVYLGSPSTPPGVEYEINPNYRVRNDTDCATGKFATGFGSNGVIQCKEAPVPDSIVPGMVSLAAPVGIPDDGNWKTVLSLTPPPGQVHLALAKLVVNSERNVDWFKTVACRLTTDGAQADVVTLGSSTTDEVSQIPLALMTTSFGNATSFKVECRADDGADGITVEEAKLIAVRLAS